MKNQGPEVFQLDKNVAKVCKRVLMRAQRMNSHQVSQRCEYSILEKIEHANMIGQKRP